MDYLKENLKLLVKSFNANKRTIVITAAYEMVLALTSYAILFIWSLWEMSLLSKINVDITELTEEMIRDVALLKNFYYGTLVSLPVLAILFFLLWSFFKGIVWCVISDKHFNLEYFKKFILLNIACIPLCLVIIFVFLITAGIFSYLFVFVSTSIQNSFLSILSTSFLWIFVFMPILVYMTVPLQLVYYNFAIKNDIKNAFNEMFEKTIKKTRLFYLPCLFVTVVFLLISILTIPLNKLPESIVFLVLMIILVLYLSWERIYMISYAKSLDKSNKKHHKI